LLAMPRASLNWRSLGVNRAQMIARLEDDLADEPVEFVSERFPDRFALGKH
jgi:hypothetical protein